MSNVNTKVDPRFGKAASVLPFTPGTSLDFGPIYCYGTNEFGQQTEPCRFEVKQSSVPVTPTNCTIRNQTENSIDISCESSFGGNLPQTFVLEAYDSETKDLIINVTSSVPEFNVVFDGQVSSVRTFRDETVLSSVQNVTVLMHLYSVNAKGASNAVVMKTMLPRLKEETEIQEVSTVRHVLLGSVVGALTLFLFLFSVAVALCFRKRLGQDSLDIVQVSTDDLSGLMMTTMVSDSEGPKNYRTVPGSTGLTGSGGRADIMIRDNPLDERGKSWKRFNGYEESHCSDPGLTDSPSPLAGPQGLPVIRESSREFSDDSI